MAMKFSFGLMTAVGAVAPVLLVLAVLGAGWDRMWLKRVDRLTAFAGWSVDVAAMDADSATGYAGGVRRLVPPVEDGEAMQTIMAAQAMLASGEWVVRQVDHENAPEGRPEGTASVARWWVALLARIPGIGGAEAAQGVAVERAARLADPLLHGLWLAAMAMAAWRWFGRGAGVWVAAAAGLSYPLVTVFVPAAPARESWGVVLAGVQALALCRWRWTACRGGGESRTAALVAGLSGGALLWVCPAAQVLMAIGVALSAIWAGGWGWWQRRKADGARSGVRNGRSAIDAGGWAGLRFWAAAGAAVALSLWWLDGAGRGLPLRPERMHWAHAVAWLALGEALAGGAGVCAARRGGGTVGVRAWARAAGSGVCALGFAAAVLVAVHGYGGSALFEADPAAARLSRVGMVEAQSLGAWLAAEGASGPAMAVLLPVVVPWGLAAWLWWRRRSDEGERGAIALMGTVAAVFLVAAVVQLRWWAWLEAVLLGLIPAVVVGVRQALGLPFRRWVLAGAAILALAPGLLFVIRTAQRLGDAEWTPREAARLVARDYAWWLAARAGDAGAVVLAPPGFSTEVVYFGGLRTVASLEPQNEAGLAAAIRIVSAKSRGETQALLEARGVTHVVLPSWDLSLDALARIGRGQAGGEVPADSLVGALHRWALPLWLRPVAYSVPPLPGFDGFAVDTFAVVEEQEAAEAAARLAEFFVETGRAEALRAVRRRLARMSGNLAAAVGRARAAYALRDRAGFEEALGEVVALSSGPGGAVWMPWDRRVSLALVLADGGRMELARRELARCAAEIDAEGVRDLSTVALARFVELCGTLGLRVADPEARDLSLRLLPQAVRERVGRG
ncbi:MAG: hypothetical protein D6781_03470 [Verrucomicrobia bacterium]|nr:MAG: hypothetical protein D6781_03470 [Verrucomicrobiota bacterium]